MSEPVPASHDRPASAPIAEGAAPTAPDSAAMAGQAEAQSELAEYLDRTQQRRRLFPRAALVGLLAGAVAILVRALLAAGDTLRNGLIAGALQSPAMGWPAPMLFGAVGATLAVALVRRYAPEASGSGIPHTEAVLHRLRELRWRRVLPVKLLGGTIALGALLGLAIGDLAHLVVPSAAPIPAIFAVVGMAAR